MPRRATRSAHSPSRCRFWDVEDITPYCKLFNENFLYDERSPSGLRWKNGRRKGKPAGSCRCDDGYWKVCLQCKQYKVHQVVWILHGHAIPESLEIDHIDRNPSNNRIENLRLLTCSENALNKGSVNPQKEAALKAARDAAALRRKKAPLKASGRASVLKSEAKRPMRFRPTLPIVLADIQSRSAKKSEKLTA